MKNLICFFAILLALAGCTPSQEKDVELPAAPGAPTFSIEFLENDSNRVVVKDLSTGFFDRNWDFPNAIPLQSKRAVDTIFYPKAGEFSITLYTAVEGGGGVSKSTKIINIANDATALCDPQVGMLTGECEAPGKCWTFTTAANAVTVGPTPGSTEWYKSPVNGLQADQYDDRFCFYFEGSSFQYKNNGKSVDPWNSYLAVPYTPPTDLTWFISKGTGDAGKDQIVLPAGAFIGTWDSGPVYDITTLESDKLVIRSPIRKQDGTPGVGWFEFTLVKN